MSKHILIGLLALAPLPAMAMPAVGEVVGTTPEAATAALEAAGCMAPRFEAEDGKIEAKCQDAQMKRWEVYIDPASGQVTRIKADD